jgi:hypothetical protein
LAYGFLIVMYFLLLLCSVLFYWLKYSYRYVCSVLCIPSQCVVLCVNLYWTTATGISGQFSTTLTEVFNAFSSVVRQMSGYNSQRRGTARTSQICFLFTVMYVPFSVFCLCVNVHCTTATGCQLNCS